MPEKVVVDTDHLREQAQYTDGAINQVGGVILAVRKTKARFPTDRRGILLPAPPGAPQWFAIFENRLGRLPPWTTAPNPEAPRP